MKLIHNFFAVAAIILLGGLLTACRDSAEHSKFSEEYGVFLTADASDRSKFKNYRTVVIDAQYFSEAEILQLKNEGHTVFSYLNIGSIEDFRPYFSQYQSLCLSPYENWDEEYWVDVTNVDWQEFILNMAANLYDKQVDGLFIDNCDIYYIYPNQETFHAISKLLRSLKLQFDNIIINGGDIYLKEYIKQYQAVADILTGINQESVFTRIDFQKQSFYEAEDAVTAYYTEYLEELSGYEINIFLLEYTTDDKLREKIDEYCKKHDYLYYISDSIELDG